MVCPARWCECATLKRNVSSMPKSKIRKPSSSTSNSSIRPPRRSRSSNGSRKKVGAEFSILKFPFAIPSSLHLLLRLAACTMLLAQAMAQAGPGSLWREDYSHSMFADKRARAVGDIITILVQENNTTSKENSTKTSKSSSVDASLETILYSPAASGFLTKAGKLPAMKFGGSQSFDGGGKINNSERITARIAVRVVDTLPNGNMIV